jgi:hypothetical protein
MESKIKTQIFGIIAIIIISLISIGVTAQKSTNQSKKLLVKYHYTTEVSYYDVQIDGTKIIYTKTDDEKIKERCAQWIKQSPCWTQQDLITKEAELTSKEIADFKKFIETSKVKQLKNYYGPAQGERCYSYTLKIDKKEIVYCSRPNGPSEPEAFTKVVEKIKEIVEQKFSK